MAEAFETYFATAFSGPGHADERSGLLIASSSDGLWFRNTARGLRPDEWYTPEGGLRDPHLLWWRERFFVVYSYGPNRAPLLFIAASNDLEHWAPWATLQLAADTGNNYIDVPQWMVDPAGGLHLIACVDSNHHWVELHPLSSDPASWADQGNWSPVVDLTDLAGAPLVQGNSFVAVRDGTFYMAFNAIRAEGYFLRTSTSLTTGWSAPQPLALPAFVNGGDSESLLVLGDGRLRFYISNGNALRHLMWQTESTDGGVTWTTPERIYFEGFGGSDINWAQIVRFTDPRVMDVD